MSDKRKARGETLRAKSHHMRAKLRHAAFTKPALWLTRKGWVKNHHHQSPHVHELNVLVPDLPPALEGLKITHLSDLHIGHVLPPERLPAILEVCQNLRSDMIALTGDFVDLSLDVLDETLPHLRKLEAPLGVHYVPGNHDYLENGPEFVQRFEKAGMRLLRNDSLAVTHKDAQINVLGLDYTAEPRALHRALRRVARQAHETHGQANFNLLLAHDPKAFDLARRQNINLTLAGHTHGGQFTLAQRGKKGSIGLGSLTFRYPRGLYRRDGSYLFVTTGVGSWFPMRLGCPPEIAVLTLRKGEHLPSLRKPQRSGVHFVDKRK